jgi:hypothetical protein
LGASATSSTSSLNITDNTSASLLFVRDDGFVGLGVTSPTNTSTDKFEVTGDMFLNGSGVYSGSAWAFSDNRFKKDIIRIEGALAKVKALNGNIYSYRTDEFKNLNFSEFRTSGLIAQEVQKVLPEAVKQMANGYLAVNYDGIIPLLIEAIKEQDEKIEKILAMNPDHKGYIINDEINLLKKQIDSLKTILLSNNITANRSAITHPSNPDSIQQKIVLSDHPELQQNEPNPFNSSTLIRYYLPSAISNAVLKITDSNGKELVSYRLVNTGYSYVNVETEYISSGVYVYSLLVGDKVIDSKKMIVGQ